MPRHKLETPRVMMPLRFDPVLVERIRAFAATQDKSMNKAVETLLDRALALRGH